MAHAASPSVAPSVADVTVVGAGLIGLASALALADRGLSVLLVGSKHAGEASPAGAGMLAPSVEDSHSPSGRDPGRQFAMASLERYPGYLDSLAARTGITVPLNRRGILRVALDDSGANDLRQHGGAHGQWLSPGAVREMEPGLVSTAGAMFYPGDGAADNVVLLHALDVAIERSPRIHRIRDDVRTIAPGASPATCTLANGHTISSSYIVLAAGAWTTQIEGLPRAIPVEPYRGQMFSVAATGAAALSRVVYGPDSYIVPRGDRILVGATMERAGFHAVTTEAALASVRAKVAAYWPIAASAPALSAWAGLRPVTPDLLPILGQDPEYPALIYACGHSRNGILMAPLTGDCVAALVIGTAVPASLAAFAVERFTVGAGDAGAHDTASGTSGGARNGSRSEVPS
jgi:glycine oxidase